MTQILNNIKKSFNAWLAEELEGETINFDGDPFRTDDLEAWYAVRYAGYSSESTGMDDIIAETGTQKGMYRILDAEVSAWCRDDKQRASLGEMTDKLMELCEEVSITLYDFEDPENPEETGLIYLRAKKGVFSPRWSGGSRVLKTDSDAHERMRVVGFVLEVELRVLAEV
ncbi:MAG: hypothetical protein ABIC40_05250 [bacterium]